MSDPQDHTTEPNRDDRLSALFAQLVMQQANLATMLLGKAPNPQSGEAVKDVEAARLFIDELEMLEAKTKGNLTKDESALLKQTLMSLRMAFVEAVETPEPAKPKPAPQPSAPAAEPTAPAAEESHKKFTKKY